MLHLTHLLLACLLVSTPQAPASAGWTKAYLTGKFEPSQHPDFVVIATADANKPGLYLRQDAYAAFQKMRAAAAKEGITLTIVSATRNFAQQKAIWEAKWSGQRLLSNGENAAKAYPKARDRALKIMEYSAMPGASRHHWGTDIDLNNLSNAWFEEGTGRKIYNWLQVNAARYGFCQPYTPRGSARPTGYLEEKWHWTYLPVSQELTAAAAQQLTDQDLTGFSGAGAAVEIGVIKKFVLGINASCR